MNVLVLFCRACVCVSYVLNRSLLLIERQKTGKTDTEIVIYQFIFRIVLNCSMLSIIPSLVLINACIHFVSFSLRFCCLWFFFSFYSFFHIIRTNIVNLFDLFNLNSKNKDWKKSIWPISSLKWMNSNAKWNWHSVLFFVYLNIEMRHRIQYNTIQYTVHTTLNIWNIIPN